MTKLLSILVVVAALVGGAVAWMFYSKGQIIPLPTPAPLSLPADATTSEMNMMLKTTEDDEGRSDLLQLEQEVNQF